MPHKHRSRKGLNKVEKKQVLSLINKQDDVKVKEEAFTDSSLTEASPASDQVPGAIAQGDGDAERIGDRLRFKDISYRYQVNSGTASGLVRFTMYQELEDEEPDMNTFVLPNDFWPDLNASVAKYQILVDKVIELAPDIKERHLFSGRIPVKKLRMKGLEYADASTTIRGGGQLRIRILTDNTTASQMTVDGNYKVRYYG